MQGAGSFDKLPALLTFTHLPESVMACILSAANAAGLAATQTDGFADRDATDAARAAVKTAARAAPVVGIRIVSNKE